MTSDTKFKTDQIESYKSQKDKLAEELTKFKTKYVSLKKSKTTLDRMMVHYQEQFAKNKEIEISYYKLLEK